MIFSNNLSRIDIHRAILSGHVLNLDISTHFHAEGKGPDDDPTIFTAIQTINTGLLPHPDLYTAWEPFRVHFTLMTEMLDVEDYDKDIFNEKRREKRDDDIIKTAWVNGIDFKPEGFTIAGNKALKSGKILKMNTPKTVIAELENYKFYDLLQEHIYELTEELTLYLNGKCAMKQLDIFDEMDDTTGTAVVLASDDKEKKKRGRKPKDYKVSYTIGEGLLS